MDDSSPYEPVAPNRHPDAFRLASISSGIAGWVFFFFTVHLEFSYKKGDICSREGELEVNNNNKGACEEPASMFPRQHSNSQLSSWLII